MGQAGVEKPKKLIPVHSRHEKMVNDNYTSPSTTITLPQTGTRRNYRSGALETRFCACFPDILSV